MSSSDETAVLLFTIQQLKNHGSWCGETHIQKTVYLCQQVAKIDNFFKFVLYKHGPYSFELSDKLQSLIADEIIKIQTRAPYGPSLIVADDINQHRLINQIDKETGKKIEIACKKFGRKSVSELERLSTAVFLNNKHGLDRPVSERVSEMRLLKPHIKEDAAKEAFTEADSLMSFAQ